MGFPKHIQHLPKACLALRLVSAGGGAGNWGNGQSTSSGICGTFCKKGMSCTPPCQSAGCSNCAGRRRAFGIQSGGANSYPTSTSGPSGRNPHSRLGLCGAHS